MLQLTKVLQSAKSLAVYPCAGMDWMAITFTVDEFIRHRAGNDIDYHEPDTLVYVDKQENYGQQAHWRNGIIFEDNATKITLVEKETASSQFGPAPVCKIEWRSTAKPTWREKDIPERSKTLVFVNADWKDFSIYMAQNHIRSHIGIGVTDGCRFGGNRECVNFLGVYPNFTGNFRERAQSPGAHPEYARQYTITHEHIARYWITDHFTNATNTPFANDGEYILSDDSSFPFKFKKICLLSSDWGAYGQLTHPYLGGATLFKIETANN